MSSLFLKNIINFPKNKKFKSFVLIYFFIFIIFFAILMIKNISKDNLEAQLNEDGNRLVIVSEYYKESLDKVLNKYASDIELAQYKIYYLPFNINNRSYNIRTVDDDFGFSHTSIKVHPSYNGGKNIFNILVENINYDELLDPDTIIINQKLAKSICEDNSTYCSVYLTIKDYLKIPTLLKELENNNIEANANLQEDDNMILYKNLYEALSIFFIIFIGTIVVISVLITFGITEEQKRNIIIYHSIGYPLKNIIMIYLVNNLFYLFLIYLLVLLNIFIILIIINLVFHQLFISYIMNIFYIPFIVIIIINIIITTLLITFMKRKFYQ